MITQERITSQLIQRAIEETKDKLIAELEMIYYENGQHISTAKLQRKLAKRDKDKRELETHNRTLTRLNGRDEGIKRCLHFLVHHKREGSGLADKNGWHPDNFKHARRRIGE